MMCMITTDTAGSCVLLIIMGLILLPHTDRTPRRTVYSWGNERDNRHGHGSWIMASVL